MRRLLTILIPLLLPTLLYFGYIWFGRQRAAPSPSAAPSARDVPWLWLGIAGLLLLAVTLVASALYGGAEPGSHYEPPQLIDGQVQPGGFSNGN
jgi:Family of unknown function (DUF6111)